METLDTSKALMEIRPIAKELNIRVDADENMLYLNGQGIGIMWNSTYATVTEFIAYAFLRLCEQEYRFRDCLTKELEEAVKRHWYSEEKPEVD